MKFLTIFIFAFMLMHSGFSQTLKNDSKVKYDKVTLTHNTTISKDSALATLPTLASVIESDNLMNPSVMESFGPYSVNFYPQVDDGIIYVQFDNLEKNIKPELYLSDIDGNEIYRIKGQTRLNLINLRRIASGNYLFTIEVNKEVSTWEIVKE